MEVHFTPEVQTKLEQMARETGRPSNELVVDAVIGCRRRAFTAWAGTVCPRQLERLS